MKIYSIQTYIEASNELSRTDIKRLIDRDLNRGDGIYMRVGSGCTINLDSVRTKRANAKYGKND